MSFQVELERKISEDIKKWYKDSDKALLIKGARQVGKTYTIRKTLSDLNVDYIEINLIQTPQAIDVLKNASTIDEFVMGVSTFTDKRFVKGETVIFIDEAQKYKELVTKIKFFVDDGSFRITSGNPRFFKCRDESA